MSILSKPYFHNEAEAYKHLESLLWPNGPVCPHCGSKDKVYVLEGVKSKPTKKNPEGKERMGLKKCGACRQQFTVTVDTVYESSHIPLHKWLQATYLMCSSKKGISAHQIHRALEVTYKTAWFMCHRIREAMKDGSVTPLGGQGKVVEIDETYVGGKETNKHANKRGSFKGGHTGKAPVVSLVERKGCVRSFHVPEVSAQNVGAILHSQVSKKTRIMTDDGTVYNRKIMGDFASHETVNHSAKEYVRGDVYTNTIENYFSLLKRGLTGVYHHVSQQHLARYAVEFDYRYNHRQKLGFNDLDRFEKSLPGIVGKRLTYRRTGEAQA